MESSMLQSQTGAASADKQSQEEKDRAFAEQLQRKLNFEIPRVPPGGSTSLDEDDLYGDNSYHLYEDSDQVRSSDEVIASILQTDAIVPHGPVSDGTKTDLAIALELQQAEMNAVCMSDDYIAKEIASLDANTSSDSVVAREIADAEINNQLQLEDKQIEHQVKLYRFQEDEELAQSLSQAETQQAEEAEQDKRSTSLPNLPTPGMLNPLVNLFNPQRHQHRWRRGRGGHGAGRGQHREEEVETDSFEDLLALEERIGDAEGQGLNSDQLNMLPVARYTSNSGGDNECKVCFSKFELNETVRTLPCCHLFHQECIDGWIKDHNSCPICRKGIREELHH